MAASPPRVYLGHGASGTAVSMRPYVEALRRRKVEATAIDLPRRGRSVVRAEAAVPAFLAAIGDPATAVIGGHSYGGRVASMLAADVAVHGLVLLSYPLHRPGHPEDLRTEHWPRIHCPVLLLSGDADPFARIDLLRTAVGLLPSGTLQIYPGLHHGLTAVADDAAERIAAFVRSLPHAS
ncbi:MAG TPA: alpha/beta fold hydrolase [Candidatus Limnocylindrales bacterium]|nr:alpha/beta fold hydrolase [Candidatus Limnocylindrales bacterium]